MSIKQRNMIKKVFKTPLFDHIQETIFLNHLGLGPSIEQFLLSCICILSRAMGHA